MDVNPGDRASSCSGMMEPVGVRQSHGEYDVLHHCQACNFERYTRVTKNDNLDIIVKLSANI